MQPCLNIKNKDMLQVCLVAFVIWQCTIKTGNAFPHAVLTSSPFYLSARSNCHHLAPYHQFQHQSLPMKLMAAWDTNINGDSASSVSSLVIAAITVTSQTEEWVQPLSNVLDPFLNFMSFAMLARVVLSWYPEIIASNNINSSSNESPPTTTLEQPSSEKLITTETMTSSASDEVPDSSTSNSKKASLPIWITLIVIPTQPLLRAVKDIVPPAFGVDITPVFWLAIFTFVHEILLGQQGLLTMKIKYGI